MVRVPRLRDALSEPRFEAYRTSATTTDLECLARYVWNTALCEALYPTVQHLEVALRNAIHDACTVEFGTEFWFDDPTLIDDGKTLSIIAHAKAGLSRAGKPIEAGRVIAELHFGFWRQLFFNKYEKKLWRKIIKEVFPFAPPAAQQRSALGPMVHRAKELRNRVFHHEPIFHWADLREQHQDLHAVIGWISPPLAAVATETDRFLQVFATDPNHFVTSLHDLSI
jgi:hypothetical protein